MDELSESNEAFACAAAIEFDSALAVLAALANARAGCELGGLVAKADLIGDDSAVILGLLVEAAATLRGEGREQRLMLWRRRGKRALDAAKVE